MNVMALVMMPFLAWHTYRAIHAFRTGAFESFGGVLYRVSAPALFWFRLARESLLATLFAALFLSLLFGFGGPTASWLFGGYFAVYVTVIFTTIIRHRRRPDQAPCIDSAWKSPRAAWWRSKRGIQQPSARKGDATTP